jgi:hypothetical protein
MKTTPCLIAFLALLLAAPVSIAACDGKRAASVMSDTRLTPERKRYLIDAYGCDARGLSVETAGDKNEKRAFNARRYQAARAENRNKPEAVEDYRAAMAKKCGGKYPLPLRAGMRESDLNKGCAGAATLKGTAGAVKTYFVGNRLATVKNGYVVTVKNR